MKILKLIKPWLSLSVIIIFFNLSSSLYSKPTLNIPFSDLFSASEIKSIKKGKILSRVYLKNKGSVSNTKFCKIPQKFSIDSFKLSLKSYDMVAIEKTFVPGSFSDFRKIYNRLINHSSVKGMPYYSRSGNKIKTLVVDSYRIKYIDEQDKMRDPYFKSIPKIYVSYSLMKDNNLGKLLMMNNTKKIGLGIFQYRVSKNNVSKFGFSVFYPNDYKSFRIIKYSKKNKGFFYYSLSLMRVRSNVLQSFNLISAESFGNRMRAETLHLFNIIKKYPLSTISPFK